MCGCGKACLILIPFRLPQVSCFTLNLKCFSSDSDNCPDVGIGPLLQFPHLPRAWTVLLTLLFFPLVPSSYWVLRGSIYSFPLVRYSCLLSAVVLQALLCLKVYNWCIHGDRCTPHSPTPPPSSYVLDFAFIAFVFNVKSKNILPIWMLKKIFPMFYSRSFMVLSLMFKSLMHFELIFEYGVR